MFRPPESLTKLGTKNRLAQVVVTVLVALIVGAWFLRTTELPEKVEAKVAQIQATDPKERAQFYLDQGMKHLKKSEFEEADKSFSEAIKQDNSNAEAYYQRGLTRRNLNKFIEARLDQNRAIRLDSNHAGAYRERGWITYLQGKLDEAMGDLQKSVSLTDDFEAYLAIGMIYYQKQEWLSAIDTLSKVIDLRPDTLPSSQVSMFYEARGISYFSTGQIDKGVEDLNRAIGVDPIRRTDFRKHLTGLQQDLAKLNPESSTYKNLEKLIKRIEA